MKGKIISNVAGIYTVVDFASDIAYKVKPKGIFRFRGLSPMVGDDVIFNEQEITELLERRNSFIRPRIVNVDYFFLVTSIKKPDLSFELLDRYLVNIGRSDVKTIIIVTKCDLATKEELKATKDVLAYYEKYYPIFFSDKNGLYEKDKFNELIKGKISVVSGQTGVGKSHLLNSISPLLNLETQEISKALGRGKHTTRDTKLIDFGGAFIADTPGFSSIDFLDILPSDLKEYYPDFVEQLNKCRFNQCLHIKEPGCKIKELVESGLIVKSRYDSYVKIYNELKDQKPIYRKVK